ncbi:uridine kinase family protein [Flexivirga oryzae]|uniref:Uridine kinase n=1 Tax=Flexivirga oryzae TaxID=1794944 RepID=A0A839N5G4_9MICO|nr:ATP-binding protein [Flexivirga oryzae]MBB2892527.1 uridine kinase [Flexivirga oryzae]
MTDESSPHARVLVLGGPSGSGKSRWSAHLSREHRWPIVRLDDYYKDADDPSLPMSSLGIADWDDVRSWRCDDAVDALEQLCRTGELVAPVYDIAASAATGTQQVRLGGADTVIAEGIFAPYVIGPLRERGLLAGAYCVHHNRWVTFARRLVRDLSERRKPPLVLIRRGLRLAAAEPQIVADQRRLGAEPIRPKVLDRQLRADHLGSMHEQRMDEPWG